MNDTNDTKKNQEKSSCNTRSRGRCWAFTWNNYKEEDIKNLINMLETYVFQEEVGASGTKHLQGCLKFKNPRSFNSIKKLVPSAHVEKCRNWNASCHYCSKEATRVGKLYVSNDMAHLTHRHNKVVKKISKDEFLQNVFKKIMDNCNDNYMFYDPCIGGLRK